MSHDYVVVYESPQRRACMEMRLVLSAIGMSGHVSRRAGQWLLMVAASQRDAAVAELSEYQRDETDVAAKRTPRSAVRLADFEAIVGYALVIIVCTAASWYAAGGPMMSEVGRVDAGLVQDGQWWRAVTALTLHVDLTHLMSNLVFGALFGILAAGWLGGGVAWMLILLGGTVGNLINAYFHDASHLSIGASTAVFAALGIAVANALRPSLRANRRWMRQWSPLIAGVLLLAMVGTGGERTDVGAHVAGFFTGVVGGWASSYLPARWLQDKLVQHAVGVAALAAVILAWATAWSMA